MNQENAKDRIIKRIGNLTPMQHEWLEKEIDEIIESAKWEEKILPGPGIGQGEL